MRSGVRSPSTPPTFKRLFGVAFFFGINLGINLLHIGAPNAFARMTSLTTILLKKRKPQQLMRWRKEWRKNIKDEQFESLKSSCGDVKLMLGSILKNKLDEPDILMQTIHQRHRVRQKDIVRRRRLLIWQSRISYSLFSDQLATTGYLFLPILQNLHKRAGAQLFQRKTCQILRFLFGQSAAVDSAEEIIK